MSRIMKWVLLFGLLVVSVVFLLNHFLLVKCPEDSVTTTTTDDHKLSTTGSICPVTVRPLAELRANAQILLRGAIDYVISFEADLSILEVASSWGQKLFHSGALKADKRNRPLAPALYVFGDSLSDSGNNNFLQTFVGVNYKPYGIDFPFGTTGRYTNGKTFVDFIANLLGLPFVPPYLGLLTNGEINITTGVNYASGGAGILPETGTALGENLSFNKQIKYFQDTITNDLLRIFKTPDEFLEYLSKSIFLISIGNNDYINNYLQPANYKSSQMFTPWRFADLLIDELIRGLKKLYNLGGRKFLVFNIGRIGCIPSIVKNANPKPTTTCVEDVNKLVLLFNTRLPSTLKELEQALVGSTFVHGDSYSATQDFSSSGSTATQTPCCEVGDGGMCLPDQTPCQDRTAFIFWDEFHPTEVVYNHLASDCFSGSSCVPINVEQLAQKL
ncbi:GDSL esterase/lipase [Thalictrum thalictroides]|uniref:GDSL esterase/lipase n=1 Tax=Thalictrum thalictroides TaxID=46969 RepID=A0A7J6W0J2_THATH|nr:GDSL esterase/lipase [Thalictrum thalictroides]